MNILKSFLRGLSSQLFKLCLFFAATSAAAVMVFGSPEPVKTAIKDSGAYSSVADAVFDTVKDNQTRNPDTADGNIPLDDPAIQAAIKDALPPEFIEQVSAGAIDGIFGWLQGKTEQPQFSIDFSAAAQRIADGTAEAGYNRVNGLPVCTLTQVRQLDPNNTNIFELPCRPPGVDLKAEQARFESALKSNNEFLQDPVVTQDDYLSSNGKNVFDQLKLLPVLYKWLVYSSWILGGLALITGVGVILLHNERRRGIWIVGRTMLATGVVLAAGALLVSYLAGQVKSEGANELAALVPGIVKNLASQFNRVLIIIGAAYGVAGAGVMLAIRLTRPKITAKEQETTPVVEAQQADTHSSAGSNEAEQQAVPEKPEDKVE